METKLEKEVRFLKIYAAVATLFCAVFLLSAFVMQSKKQKFEGMIFFNERGDEVGGLIFSGDTGKERYGSLTFDKFRGDPLRFNIWKIAMAIISRV